jgi:hypothetical protein
VRSDSLKHRWHAVSEDSFERCQRAVRSCERAVELQPSVVPGHGGTDDVPCLDTVPGPMGTEAET